jgi:hypothetical protein
MLARLVAAEPSSMAELAGSSSPKIFRFRSVMVRRLLVSIFTFRLSNKADIKSFWGGRNLGNYCVSSVES